MVRPDLSGVCGKKTRTKLTYVSHLNSNDGSDLKRRKMQDLEVHRLWHLLLQGTEHPTNQFSSITQLSPPLCDSMDCKMPGFAVHHQLPELAQIHVHQVSDAIQPSHSLSSPYPPLVFSLSQHQSLFHWVSSLHQVAKVLEFQLQHQSFQWLFRTDFL